MDGPRILDRRGGRPLEIEPSRVDRDGNGHRVLRSKGRGRNGFRCRDLISSRLCGQDILQFQRVGIDVQIDVRAVLPAIGDREALGQTRQRAPQRNVVPVDDLRDRRSGRTGGKTDPRDRNGIHRPDRNDVDRALLQGRMREEIVRKRQALVSSDEETERESRAPVAETVQFVRAALQNVAVVLDLPADLVAGHFLREIVDRVVICVEDHPPDAVETQGRPLYVLVDGDPVETGLSDVDPVQKNAVVMLVDPLEILDVVGIRVDRVFRRSVEIERKDRPFRTDPGPKIVARRFGERPLERKGNEHLVLGKVVRGKHIGDRKALFASEFIELPLDRIDIVLTAAETLQRPQRIKRRFDVEKDGQRFASLLDRDPGDGLVVENRNGHGGYGFPVEGLGDHDGLRSAAREPGHNVGVRRLVVVVDEFPVPESLSEETEEEHARNETGGDDSREEDSGTEPGPSSLFQFFNVDPRSGADQRDQQRRENVATEKDQRGEGRHDPIDAVKAVKESEPERNPGNCRGVNDVQRDRRTDARVGEPHQNDHNDVQSGDQENGQSVGRINTPEEQDRDRNGVRQKPERERGVYVCFAFFDPVRHLILPSDMRIRFGPLRYPVFCRSSLSDR